MTTNLKISDDNAKSIGQPIFDKIIQSYSNSDREELIRHFTELQQWMTPELFDEVATHLNTLGELLSSEFSTYSTENDIHLLNWQAHYKNDENTVNWVLKLNDSREGIKVHGFAYDR